MERSDTKPEKRRTLRTDSIRWGSKGDVEWARDSHRITQHQVRAGRGAGDCATRTTERSYWDQGLAGYKTCRGHPHVIEFRLQGMGDGGGDLIPGRGFHHREERVVMVGWRSAKLWSERVNFYSHVSTKTLICCRVIRSPQRPNFGPSDNIYFNTRAGGGGEASIRRSQHLPGPFGGSKRVAS